MIELAIPSMTCGHCVRTVTETVRRVDPGATVSVDLPSHAVRIDSHQPPQPFVDALTEEGYPPA